MARLWGLLLGMSLDLTSVDPDDGRTWEVTLTTNGSDSTHFKGRTRGQTYARQLIGTAKFTLLEESSSQDASLHCLHHACLTYKFPRFRSGFYVQARPATSSMSSFATSDILGRWLVTDGPTAVFSQPYSCFNGPNNVVGHKNNGERRIAKLKWQPPSNVTGW